MSVENPRELGARLAVEQHALATLWNDDGPRAVLERLKLHYSAEELRSLLMMNIGSQALNIRDSRQ